MKKKIQQKSNISECITANRINVISLLNIEGFVFLLVPTSFLRRFTHGIGDFRLQTVTTMTGRTNTMDFIRKKSK